MKCVLLITDGELIEGAREIHEHGFQLVPYPVTGKTENLLNTKSDELIPFLGFSPEKVDRSVARSLRSSFVRMLRDEHFKNDDYIIFGESDACPLCDAETLKRDIMIEMAKYPDVDVFRLYREASKLPVNAPERGKYVFHNFEAGETSQDSPCVWGTYAFLIPSAKREKVAAVFEHYHLPADIALEAACSAGELKIRVSEKNLFYQKPRSKFESTDLTGPCRKRKFAVILPSYKRLEDLLRQIWSIMDQDYDHAHYHMFAAVKGISKRTYERMIVPYFRHFMEEGRLTLRLCSNKNQLSNILDAVRGEDLSGYDLFAKIDDDDFYARDYLSRLNEVHRFLPDGFCSFYRGWGYFVNDRFGYPVANRGFHSILGPSMVMGRAVLEKLFEFEESPEKALESSPLTKKRHGHTAFGFNEDNLMHTLLDEYGTCNRAPYIHAFDRPMHFAVQCGKASVMRGGLLSEDFTHRNYQICRDERNDEYLVDITHPGWDDVLRILGDRAFRLGAEEEDATIIEQTENTFTLNWDKWGTETFVRMPDESYKLQIPD